MDKTSDISRMIRALSEDKSDLNASIYSALEEALSTVMARKFPEGASVRVGLNQEKNDAPFTMTRHWMVVETANDIEDPEAQKELKEAKTIDKNATVGAEVVESLEALPFNRIDVHQAKQLVTRLVREEKRSLASEQYEKQKLGTLISAEIIKTTPAGIFLDLGDEYLEGFIPKKEMLPGEFFRRGECVKAYVSNIDHEKKRPTVMMSRACPEMVTELFQVEVPEMHEGVIEIKKIAREPGARSKIAVKSKDSRIDPVGACVGMRGARVQAVSNELNGERIDIISWDDDPAHFVINALAPATPKSIDVDEERKIMNIAVDEDQLAQVIGRGGQNIRLANQLTGWTLNVMNETDKETLNAMAHGQASKGLKEALDIDDNMASVLISSNYRRLNQVAQAADADLAKLNGFNLELAQELSKRAKSALLKQALSNKKTDLEPSEELLKLSSLPAKMAYQLAEANIVTLDNLADLSTSELQEILTEIEPEKAASIIMEARAPMLKQLDKDAKKHLDGDE